MEIIGLNFVYAAVSLILMFLAYRPIDWLTPEVHFLDELQKGNIADSVIRKRPATS